MVMEMRSRKELVSTIVLGVMTVSAGMTMIAGQANASHCSLFANKPVQHGTTMSGTGGRQSCADTVGSVAVAEYHQISHWPDSRMASARRTNVKNASLTVTGHGKHGWDVYTRVDSSTEAQTKSGYTRVG
ncbi:hypothetical protein U6J73_09705 [Cutibacterium acnes]|uniref:hypothetical protein n=1 Tax=Cutibacterium acnes TaxID=1747 RepID=UPI000C1F790D|nr:hypothetical protein [Cutibacterium acnes]MDF2230519.1 hypothetical protein [Cutibacterium acnes subsp. defendens]PIS93377.1 hypothetical protein CER06_02345 [Cutibacterium acnes]WHE32543.1 hypothetical protein O2A76_10525 [Cutibacterium acnes subsp. acnes]